MVRLTGLNAFKIKTEAQKARIKQKATLYVQQKVVAVLRDLVLNVPQFSGDLAASWTVITSNVSPLQGYSPLKQWDWGDPSFSPKFIGDKEAYRIALAVNDSIIKSLRWNSNISIVNTSPTAGQIATESLGEGWFRPGNYIPGDILAIETVKQKHKWL